MLHKTMPCKKKLCGLSRAAPGTSKAKVGKLYSKAEKELKKKAEEVKEAKIDEEPFPTPQSESDGDTKDDDEEVEEGPMTEEQRLEAFFWSTSWKSKRSRFLTKWQ
jgi:hypothetical protein